MLLYEEILYEYIEFKKPKKKTEKGKILEIIYAKLIRVISKIKNLYGFVKKLGLLNCILLFISKLVDCLEKCLIYGHIRRVAD